MIAKRGEFAGVPALLEKLESRMRQIESELEQFMREKNRG